MGIFLRLLLVADLILGSVTVPLTVAGFGLGSGAGGSSFFQKTDLKNSTSDQAAALVLLKRVCDEGKWNEAQKASPELPAYPTQSSDIAQLVNPELASWQTLCVQKPDGIIIQGDLAQEMQLLFANRWDRRVLYSLVYLYQKRFGKDGYKVVCSEGDKFAPEMTVAVHFDESPLNFQANPAAAKQLPEDDPLVGSDPNTSPHGRGQAFDILTFGCVKIVDQQNNSFQFVPTALAIGQSKTAGGQVMDDQAAIAALGRIDPDLPGIVGTIQNSPPNFYRAGVQVQNLDPMLAASGIPIVGTSPADQIAVVLASATTSEADLSALAAEVTAAQLETSQGLPAGALAAGVADVNQIGASVLSQNLGLDFNTLLKEKDSTKKQPTESLLEKLLAGTSDGMFGLPDGTLDLLRQKQYQRAAAQAGADELQEHFSLNLSSAELEQALRTGRLPAGALERLPLPATVAEQTKMFEALWRGGTKEIEAEIGRIDQARQDQDAYQLALTLLNATSQSEAQIATLRDFFSTDSVVRDGATRRYEGDTTIASWMSNHLQMNNETLALCRQVIMAYEKSPDHKIALKSFVAPTRAQILSATISRLPGDFQTILNQAASSSPATAQDLETIWKDGSLKKAAEQYQLTRSLTQAGLSPQEAEATAYAVVSGEASAQTALDFLNRRSGFNLTLEDFKTTGQFGAPRATQKVAFGYLSERTGLSAQEIETAISGSGEARAAAQGHLAQTAAARLGIPDWLARAAINFDTPKLAEAGAKTQADRVGKQLARSSQKSLAPFGEQKSEDISDKLEEALKKGVSSAKDEGRRQAQEMLVAQGISAADAQILARGQFSQADEVVGAAILSRSGFDYETCKRLIGGRSSESDRYALGDTMLTPQLRDLGLPAEAGFTKSLIKSTGQERNEIARGFGAHLAAGELSEQAGQVGLTLSSGQAEEILKNKDWEALGNLAKESGYTTVAERAAAALSQSSGGWLAISSEEVKRRIEANDSTGLDELAKESYKSGFAQVLNDATDGVIPEDSARQMIDEWQKSPKDSLKSLKSFGQDYGKNLAGEKISATTGGLLSPEQTLSLYEKAKTTGLTGADTKNLGWGAVEKYTGFNEEKFNNFDQTFKEAQTNFVGQFADWSTLAGSTGGGIVVSQLLGETLVKIDPTGGLAACYALGWAQSQLLALGVAAPALLAAAFILNPQATLASIQTVFNQATMLLTNPTGFIAGLLGTFGFNKPKSGTPVKNAAFRQKDILSADEVQKLKATNKLGSWISGTPAASAYLSDTTQPDFEYLRQVAHRTIDQIGEDIMLFSLASRDQSYRANHWTLFMTNIQPNENFAVKQLILPRALVESNQYDTVKNVTSDFLYDPDKEDQSGAKDAAYLLGLARQIFGASFDPLKTSGRRPGVLFDSKIPDRVHIGY